MAFAWMALLIGIGNAAFWTIFPLILDDVVGDESKVGLYYSALSVISLVASILSTALFTRVSKVKIMHVTMILAIVMLVGMTFVEKLFHIAGLDVPRAVCVLLFTTCLSLFVYDFSTKERLALDEARYYLFANIGWVVGPVVGGTIAKLYGNQSIFIFVSAWFALALLYFTHMHLVVRHPHLHHGTHDITVRDLFANLVEYMRTLSLLKVLGVALGLNFWFTISAIYIPLAIEDMGYGQDVVGLVITGSMVPLMLLEGPVGKVAAKVGIRLPVMCGFFVLATVTALYGSLSPWPAALLFAFAAVNVGAAMIEPLQETFFFQSVKKKDVGRFFGIYNTAEPIASITGPLMASIAFGIGGYASIWVFLSGAMMVFLFISLFIPKKTVEKTA